MLAIAPEDSSIWRQFALAQMQRNPNDYSERQDAPTAASSAALNAYLRADGAAEQALSLALLGQALEKREMWKAAIKTYRLSLEYKADSAIRTAYEKLLDRKSTRLNSSH